MKKLAFISLISLMLISSQVSAEVIRDSNFYNENEYLEALDEEFFESGLVPVSKQEQTSDDMLDTSDFASYDSLIGGGGGELRPLKAMPVFKKYRIKIQNHYKTKEHEQMLKEQSLLNKQSEVSSSDDNYQESLEELTKNILKKRYVDEDGNEVKVSFFSKFKNIFKRDKDVDAHLMTYKSSKKVKDSEVTFDEENPVLSGGVREVEATKDMILDCDKLSFDEETSEMEAIGNPIMTFPAQNVSIKAKRLTYNTESNIIKAYDDVEIIKDGSPIYGDYVMINLNDESSVVTNMHAEKMKMFVNAKDVIASEDSIELKEGSMVGEKHYKLRLRSGMMGSRLGEIYVPEDEKSYLSENGLEVKVKAKDVYVTAKKSHDVITVKDADIYYKNKFLAHLPSFTAHTNKGQEYFEANYPEFGSIPRIGMFAGPGFVFDVPNGATAKVIPFVNYKDKWGVGAALKYRSGTNFTEMYYGTANDMFILRGRQFLDDRLYLQYGINSYQDEWFLGSGMAKYRMEAVYRDATTIPNTLGKGRHARYRQRISAGYLQDANYNRKGEHLGTGTMGTTRLKYMAELSQSLYSFSNKDNTMNASLSWIMQGSASLYGTGDTQFIARTGPALHTQYRRWSQDIVYLLSGYHDESPIPKLDIYRYGTSTVSLREAVRLNKYLTASWRISTALSDDAPNNKLFQENGVFLSIGPDDAKFTLGYDFIRERTYFLLNTAIDLKGTQVDYKKMVIKNPEALGHDKSEKVEPVSFDSGANSKIKRTYAQVIEIEDPDREQL